MFNSLLKELRAQKGMTQGQLAKEVGVSAGNVGDWETGKSKPGYNALASLARIFEVSADYLLELNMVHAKQSIDLTDFKAEQGLACDGSSLTEMEADVVAMFRLLPESHKEELFDLIYFKYKRQVEDKKSSIYSTYFTENDDEKSGSDEGNNTSHETA